MSFVQLSGRTADLGTSNTAGSTGGGNNEVRRLKVSVRVEAAPNKEAEATLMLQRGLQEASGGALGNAPYAQGAQVEEAAPTNVSMIATEADPLMPTGNAHLPECAQNKTSHGRGAILLQASITNARKQLQEVSKYVTYDAKKQCGVRRSGVTRALGPYSPEVPVQQEQ
eukprot:Selendium_serpulae@DN6307_c0_g1_i1.p2